MSSREIADRLRQRVTSRVDGLRYKLGFPPEPGIGEISASRREPQFFFSETATDALCRRIHERFPGQREAILRQAEKACAHTFDLLGYRGLDYGAEIDWHCDGVHAKRAPRKPFFAIRYLDFRVVGDSKVTWELNRHQHFVTLAKAFRLTEDPKFAAELFRQWSQWHRENPYPIGINWASSLEVAFRSLSWLWMYFLLRGSTPMSDQFRRELNRHLGLSARHIETYLSTYFSANTHLLGEAVALFFVGTLCPQLKDAGRWQRLGWEIVQQEAGRQVRADGLHFEQSTYYHVYALDFFLHTLILASLNGIPIPAAFERRVEKMCEGLCILGRSGPLPRFGDDDGGRLFDPQRNCTEHLLDPLSTGAVLFGRPDFKAVAGEPCEEMLWLLGESGLEEYDRLQAKPPAHDSHAFRESGLYVMSDGSEQLVIDAGPQGAHTAGHGHADALSVVVNCAGRPLLIDPGTYEYVGAGDQRDCFRGTQAHNTLAVDGLSQSEPGGPFAWGRLPNVRAEGWISGESFDLFAGSHDGFMRLTNPVLHRRFVFFLKNQFWLVRDQVIGTGKHELQLSWHLASDLVPMDGRKKMFKSDNLEFAIFAADDRGWSRELIENECSPCYGRRQCSRSLNFQYSGVLPVDFATVLLPSQKPIKCEYAFERVDVSDESVSAYRLRAVGEEHLFVFTQAQPWNLFSWSSNAEFFYLGKFPEQTRHSLICCNGTYATRGQAKVISSPEAFLRCEVSADADKVKVITSAPNVTVDQDAFRGAALHDADSETRSRVERG